MTADVFGTNRHDHTHHPGWVAVYADPVLLGRLRRTQHPDETLHATVHRVLLAGLDTLGID